MNKFVKISLIIILTFSTACSQAKLVTDIAEIQVNAEEEHSTETQINTEEDKEREYREGDVRIFLKTPVRELALAVGFEDTQQIAILAEGMSELINYQEPTYNQTLLYWAVRRDKVKSVEALLKAGADPNIFCNNGWTALYIATSFRWSEVSTRIVKLLLEYGADPNIGSSLDIIGMSPEYGTTPLMNSVQIGTLEKTIALVEAGADINAKSKHGKTAALQAMHVARSGYYETALYLIIEKQADVTQPYDSPYFDSGFNPGGELYPVNLMEEWEPEIGTEGYEVKMKLIEEFARQGVDYWAVMAAAQAAQKSIDIDIDIIDISELNDNEEEQ